MKNLSALLILFLAGSVHAAQFLKITKSDSVVGYKEPTTQSKMLSVFVAGDTVEVVGVKDGWYKVKIPFNQGYFLMGWIPQNNPNISFVTGSRPSSPAAPAPASVVASAKNNNDEDEEVVKTRRKSTGKPGRESTDKWCESDQFIKGFGGPVYSLYRYGAYQYRVGVGYEFPISQTFKMGIPISYLTGSGFNSIMGGLEGMYSIYFGSVALTPRLGFGYEYFYGNGKSFQAISTELGFAIEFSITDHITLGVEPLTAQFMGWNNTDSINKIPYNVRGQSLILVRGSW